MPNSSELAIFDGSLEIRQQGAGRILRGRFPYGRTATRRDRGRVRKERFGPNAFSYSIRRWGELQAQISKDFGELIDEVVDIRAQALIQERDRRNVHILAGHDFNKPIGDLTAGTARVTSDAKGVDFEVDLPDEAQQPSWMRDTVLAVETGRAKGVSPGFRVPPRSVVPDAERLTPEPGNPSVMIRDIREAVLSEVSIVTRPSYSGTGVEVRSEDFAPRHDAREVLTWL